MLAEFLVHESCPWVVIEKVAVIDQSTLKCVEAILEGVEYRPQALVDRDWYF